MENEGQQYNNEQDIGVIMGDDGLIYLPLGMEEYEMDALMGDEDHLSTDQAGDEDHLNTDQARDEDHLNTDQAMDGEENNINTESSPKPTKRFTVDQLQQLEFSFQECTHPDDEMRKELAAKVGLETRQVRFWFQNRRTQRKMKSYGAENNTLRKQRADLLGENKELKEQLKEITCGRCRDPTAEKWQLLDENAKLREMQLHANATLTKLIQEAADLPHSLTQEDLALITSMMNQLSSNNVGSSSSTNNQVTSSLLSYAECAIKEFEILARNGPPLWLPTISGDMLNNQEYYRLGFPILLGICPQGFAVEATRVTASVRGTASELLGILIDVPSWFQTFSGIVAAVRDYQDVYSGIFASGNVLIQEMTVDLSVESPRPPLRSMKLLRITKQTANGDFAVVDVSINGVHGVHEPEGSQNEHTSSCRLLPSGCLVQDKGDGYCQVTWIVHAEYDERIVPPIFRQFFQSGNAFGASRWLASLERHCEYKAVMQSSQVPNPSVLGVGNISSALGRLSLLELAQRMMAIFYKTTSATVEPGNIVSLLGGRRGIDGELLEPAVRMVLSNYFGAMNGQPSSVQVVTATTTVWLPGTPPERVFSYLCNKQRRCEWDTFVYAGAVREWCSVTTCPHIGNAISILGPNVPNAANNTTLLLQQESIDVSCALVVYSLVEKTLMRSIMGSGDNTSSFILLPSGFAILPDGHGNPHHNAANSSNALAARTPGCLLTAAYQVPVPFNNLGHPDVLGTYEIAGNRICQAIMKIMAAVGLDTVVPA